MPRMYAPRHFDPPDAAAMHALLRAQPLGMLVTTQAGALAADHVPFLFDAHRGPLGTLRAHVARANPLWREHDATKEVLVVFQGAESYVSPSWYPSKRADPRVVPTWNYAVVHVHGRLRAIEDAAWLRALVEELTTMHESSRELPWRVGDAPEAYLQSMLRGIVGVEIEVSRMQGKWKLSQNRSAGDREGVMRGIDALGLPDAPALARLMQVPDE